MRNSVLLFAAVLISCAKRPTDNSSLSISASMSKSTFAVGEPIEGSPRLPTQFEIAAGGSFTFHSTWKGKTGRELRRQISPGLYVMAGRAAGLETQPIPVLVTGAGQ